MKISLLKWMRVHFSKNKKFLLVMKLSLILVIIGTMSISAATTYSQQTKLSLRLENATIKDVFKEIRKKSDFSFWYSNNELNDNERVSISVSDQTIDKILQIALKNQDVHYEIKDKYILIYKPQPSVNDSTNTGGQHSRLISGTVKDVTTGEPLIGVNVVVQGTNIGTVTDISGKFSFEIPNKGLTLVISYVGYLSEEVTVSDQENLNVSLTPDIQRLDEVVVIGYGTQQKKDLTGSVASIDVKGLGTPPVPSIGDALQGRAAGVQVISAGKPGDNVVFRIRGSGTINNNDPLIVVDGIPLTSGLNQINMNDVQSVQVLKDASAAAIYGSRGANGVIIITSKRGKGDHSKVNMEYYHGIQQASNIPEMLNASEFAQMHNEMLSNAGLPTNPAFTDPLSLGKGTDWLGAMLRTAPMDNYSLSYSGSNDKTNFYVSGNYFNQQGIVIATGFKRYMVQFNSDTKVLKGLKFGNSLTLENDLKYQGDYSIQNAMMALPTQPIYRADGNYSGPVAQPLYDGDIVNPIGKANTVKTTTKGYNVHGSIYGELQIMKGLVFKSTGGLQANFWNDRTWSPEYSWDSNTQDNSYLYQQSSNSITWLWDNTLTYDNTFAGIHHLTVLLGTSAQANHFEFMNGSVQAFASDLTQQLSNGTLQPTINGNASDWSLMSYMGRVNYGYNDKYLVTATVRRDGSSRFGSGNKWGVFPSGSVAWRISKEDFFKGISFINDLKLRAGYGITGNQEIGNYTFASVLKTVKYNFSDTYVKAVVPDMMPNPNVRWESQEQSNIGLDASMFKNRIGLIVDAYVKNTRDMLVPMSVPVTTGYSDVNVPFINAGKIQNKGIEFTVSSQNFKGAFSWSTDFTVSFNSNKVISINDTVPMSTGSIGLNYNLALIQAGHPINEFYGFVTDGIFQNQAEVDQHAVQVPGDDPYNRTSPGDIRFKDLNNDGVIDDADRTFIGNPNPQAIFSLNNVFSYKGFDLNIFLQGVRGNKILNANRIFTEAMSVSHNQTKETLFRWTGEGTSNSMPRAVFNDPNNNTRASNRYIEDGSYLRLKSVSLGYTFPDNWLKAAGISSARIYASAQNLFTFTRYTGVDPEVPVNGIDNNVYPVTRTVSLGINLGF